MNILEIIWTFLQTPYGYMISGFVILFVLNKIFDARPGWAKYEGFMISAVKWVEKNIKDNSENSGMNKADAALKYFIKSYEKAKGKKPSKKLLKEVEMGLPVVHEKINNSPK